MNYYNEFDPHAAAWLNRLIKEGLIPDGHVDSRSIKEVSPADLAGYTQCHFFAGIGGWSYALDLAGWPRDRPVWTGSCPCQPFSEVGERQGIEDERHLWPEFYRLINVGKPEYVYGEQVEGAIRHGWLDGIFTDMEASNYTCWAVNLCAAGVGSPQIRQRIYWVGIANIAGLERHSGHESQGREEETGRYDATSIDTGNQSAIMDAVPVLRRMDMHDTRSPRPGLRMPFDRGMDHRSIWTEYESLPCEDGWRRVQPGTFPLANGLSGSMVKVQLRGYGNAIVPQVAAEFIKAVLTGRK